MIRMLCVTEGGYNGDAEGENWDEPAGGGPAGAPMGFILIRCASCRRDG
jgi:hypothetical protein